MLYTDMSILREQINQLYCKRTPFFFVINYEKTEGYLVEEPLTQSELFFQFPNGGNKSVAAVEKSVINFEVIPNEPGDYHKKFENLQGYFRRNELTLANLTDRTEIKTNLTLEDIFSLSESLYQVYIPNRFVCFSPERFVKIVDGTISTNPMKGTIDATLPRAAEMILEDEKEQAEHLATVTLLCEELAEVANRVHVSRFRYIDRLQTNRKDLLQVSSEIVGDLKEEYKQHIGDAIFSLLPGSSIAGEPKQKALAVLREIEGVERGYYCGIAGYFDGELLDSAVLIRFIEQDNEQFYFRSGGGVTAKSIFEKEYQEILNKVYLPFV